MEYDRKELFYCTTALIINLLIAYLITTLLGINDIILFQSMFSASNYIITYEILIWYFLNFIWAYYFEKRKKGETA